MMPGTSEPSRSEKSTLHSRPTISSTGSARTERTVAWIIAGMSGNASFTAIWLKPQDRQSSSISAIAPGLSGRPLDGFELLADIVPLGRLAAVLLLMSLRRLLAVRAGAGNFDHRKLRRKAGCACCRAERLRHG